MKPQERPAGETGSYAGALQVPAKLKRLARPLMLLVGLGFLVAAAADLVKRWDAAPVTVNPRLALASLVPLFLSAIAQGLAWIMLVESMSAHPVPRPAALRAYLLSQLARYTPGKVGLPIVRMDAAPELGLSRGMVGASVLIEMLSWTATGSFVGFACLVVFRPDQGIAAVFGKLSYLIVGATLVFGVALVSVDRSRLPGLLRSALAPHGRGALVPLGLPLVQLVYWALVLTHGFLASLAVGASPASAWETMGFYALAAVAGVVVFTSPAGLGVREAVLLAGLGPAIGATAAVGATILTRAVLLVTDLGSWLLVRRLAGSSASAQTRLRSSP